MSIYRVIDIQTGNVMGTFKTLRRAYRKVDVLDNQYGGYRFTVRSVETRNCDICGETGILPSDKHVHLSESTKSMHEVNCDDCTCADRSWYGDTHDSACAFAGQPYENFMNRKER